MFWDKYMMMCKNVGKTPTGFANELNINKSTVAGWKKGQQPAGNTVYQIAEKLGCSADFLLSDDDEDVLSFNKKHLLRYNSLSEEQKKLCDNFIQAMLMKLIIQLPCEVGSTVYLHTTVKTGRKKEKKLYRDRSTAL